MNNTSADNRGTITQRGNVMRIDNALVEEVFVGSRSTGYILISYAAKGQHRGLIHIELLQLNVGRDTIIVNQFGESVCLCDIRKGMWIDAEFSSMMTRSIPPQSSAFRIVVRQKRPAVSVTTDPIVRVDVNNGFLYTGNPRNLSSQMRFVITDTTVILDRNGRTIRLCSLRSGQLVRVEHASFQTPSIPPQTTAFRVQVL